MINTNIMIKKSILTAALAALTMALFSACSGDPNEAIVGTWACQDNSQPHVFLCNLTFDSSGNFVDGDGDGGSFIITGNVLHFDYDEYARNTVNFRIRGNRLILTSGDDVNITLSRQ